jgi:hypothetical protein
MIIEVTQDDIDCGRRYDNCACPVALALRRMFPGQSVMVYQTHAVVGGKSYLLDREGADLIYYFDRRGPNGEGQVYPRTISLRPMGV